MGLRGNQAGELVKIRKAHTEPSEAADLEAPDYLDETATAFWDRHARNLSKADLLSKQDYDCFAHLCQVYSLKTWVYGQLASNPKLMRQFLDLSNHFKALCQQFCLMPLPRKKQGIRFGEIETSEEEFDL